MDVNVSGATSYKVVDQGGDYRYMECTDTDWSKRWRPADAAYNEETRTVTWTTASTTTVCHVLYTSSSTAGSASNEAVVNDSATTLTATATADAFGEGYGDGSKVTPTPAPTPTTTEPTAPARPRWPSTVVMANLTLSPKAAGSWPVTWTSWYGARMQAPAARSPSR